MVGQQTGPLVVMNDVVVEVAGRRLLDGASLRLEAGTVASIVGPSGSGKTTLLNCLSGLRPVDRGTVEVLGVRLGGTNEKERAELRRSHIGIVFQFGELLPELTLAENVGLPLILDGNRTWREVVDAWLTQVGLGGRGSEYPDILSGGEVQRVGIARALARRPALVLADEPTGSLDADSATETAALLVKTCRDAGAGLVMVTHDDEVAALADRCLSLRRGALDDRCEHRAS